MFVLLAATWQETGADVMTGLAIGIGVLFLIIVGLIILFVGGSLVKGAFRQFVDIDRQLAGFGQTETGRYVYNRAAQLGSSFDETTDPAVMRTTAFLNGLLKELPALFKLALPAKPEALTEADVLGAVNVVRNGVLELLNGVPIQAQTPEELLTQLRQKPWGTYSETTNEDWLKGD